MGYVPAKDQVYFISYYLDRKALDFYNQIVVIDEGSWDLNRFFVELFEFCFPVDFCNKQCKRLDRCFQYSKGVAAHIAEWSEIYNTIGLVDTQEKIVKLFNSFNVDVQTEIYRKGYNPEVATWDEIIKAAEDSEVLWNLAKNAVQGSSRHPFQQNQQNQKTSETYLSSRPNNHSRPSSSRGGFRGRGRGRGGRFGGSSKPQGEFMRTSSAGAPDKTFKANEQLSPQKRNEMLAKGLCFNCGEPGHLARNCPKVNNASLKKKGKPPGFAAHGVRFSMRDSRDALNESTTVLESMHVNSARFKLSGADEGGEPLQTFSDAHLSLNGLNSDSSSYDLGDITDSEPEYIPCEPGHEYPCCAARLKAAPSPDSESAPGSPSKDSPFVSSPIGDLYAFYASLMLQEAQPYPGDISSSFKPALWYAQARCFALGLDVEAPLAESRFDEEIGDAQACAVKILLEHCEVLRGHETAGNDLYEVWAIDEELMITHHDSCMMLTLPRALLEDPNFDLLAWYDNASATYGTFDESLPTNDGSWLIAELDLMPSLPSASESELSDGSESNSMPSLQAVSRTVSECSSDEGPPDLQSISDSSEDGSDGGPDRGYSEGDGETLTDRLQMWGRAAENCGVARTSATPLRAYRLGDVLGNTVAALLDFFQPYPGNEHVAWGDDRREAIGFRVLGPYSEFYTVWTCREATVTVTMSIIEDTYTDEVTILAISNLRIPQFHLMDWYTRKRARALNIKYPRASPLHSFPVEELLGDTIQQYFRDVGLELPMFLNVEISRIPRESDDLEGSDFYLVYIPSGVYGIHEQISEETLLNPDLNLVRWVLKRQLKHALRQHQDRFEFGGTHRSGYFGILFDEPGLEMEGKFILFCGGVQIPADSMKGISRTSSTLRFTNRIVARPLSRTVTSDSLGLRGSPNRNIPILIGYFIHHMLKDSL
ncbi:hypothetical protein B0H10DRAFT_2206781 [Mycena sp. CBHHK59/15]|nr:hypothetical protein B0H10DRAFT_2206781 [Mycena sp. CBHHK59/15]